METNSYTMPWFCLSLFSLAPHMHAYFIPAGLGFICLTKLPTKRQKQSGSVIKKFSKWFWNSIENLTLQTFSLCKTRCVCSLSAAGQWPYPCNPITCTLTIWCQNTRCLSKCLNFTRKACNTASFGLQAMHSDIDCCFEAMLQKWTAVQCAFILPYRIHDGMGWRQYGCRGDDQSKGRTSVLPRIT